MSQNNFPKRPVRFQEHNQELLKSLGDSEDLAKSTVDYVNDTFVGTVPTSPQGTYRTPPDRVNGNALFRRYLNGSLDMEYACHKVIDAIHRVKASASLFPTEQIALQAIFPGQFEGDLDPAMAMAVASVQLDLVPEEVAMIRVKVARHLAEELNWNAGLGGGSVPGRSSTYEG